MLACFVCACVQPSKWPRSHCDNLPHHASSNITHRAVTGDSHELPYFSETQSQCPVFWGVYYGDLKIVKRKKKSSPRLLLFLECKNTAVCELSNSPSHHTLPDLSLSVRDLPLSPGTTKSIYTGKPLRCTFHCSSPWPTQSFTSLIHLHWDCTSAVTWLIDLLFPRTERTVFFLCCSYFPQWKTSNHSFKNRKSKPE